MLLPLGLLSGQRGRSTGPSPAVRIRPGAGAGEGDTERQAEGRGEALPAFLKHHLNPCLLDFGCLWDVSQLLVQAEDFGIFLFHNSDEIVQKGDVPRRDERRGQRGGTMGRRELGRNPCLNPNPSNELFWDFCKDAARCLSGDMGWVCPSAEQPGPCKQVPSTGGTQGR